MTRHGVHVGGGIYVEYDSDEGLVGLNAIHQGAKVLVDVTRLPALVETLERVQAQVASGECPYTMSHTRATCGRPLCREN